MEIDLVVGLSIKGLLRSSLIGNNNSLLPFHVSIPPTSMPAWPDRRELRMDVVYSYNYFTYLDMLWLSLCLALLASSYALNGSLITGANENQSKLGILIAFTDLAVSPSSPPSNTVRFPCSSPFNFNWKFSQTARPIGAVSNEVVLLLLPLGRTFLILRPSE